MPSRPVLISAMQYQDALNNGSATVLDVVATAKRLGVDGVELRRDYWRDKGYDLPAARDLVRELGLLVTYATMATLFNDDGGQQLRHDVDDARELGSPQLRVFPGRAPGDDDKLAWDSARDALRYAADQGVIVALENFAQAPGCLVADIKHVLDRFDTQALATNIDIGNYYSNGQDPVDAVRTLGRRAISSHLKDVAGSTTTYLGNGTIPLRKVLAEFDTLPQRILHCFEFLGGGDPEGRIKKSLEFLRGI